MTPPHPTATWSAFAPVAASGSVLGLQARYLQYRAALSTSDPLLTPVLRDVSIAYSAALGSATITSLVADPAHSAYGQAVTFSATVAPVSGGGTPSGSVGFTIDGKASGSSDLAGGTAFLFVSDLAPGIHTVSATYSGDTVFGASTGSLQLTVAQAATTTTLVASPGSSAYGEAVTLTARVAPVVPAPRAFGRLFEALAGEPAQPSGTVQFRDGDTDLGAPLELDADGSAVLVSAGLSAGMHDLSATYGGDANFAASTSVR